MVSARERPDAPEPLEEVCAAGRDDVAAAPPPLVPVEEDRDDAEPERRERSARGSSLHSLFV